MDEPKKENPDIEFISIKQVPIITTIKSEWIEEYQKTFSGTQNLSSIFHDLSEEQIASLRNNGIIYEPQGVFNENINIILQRESINSELMIFEVKWGRFSQIISLINSEEKNTMRSGEPRSNECKGAYASIYKFTFNNKKIAIKSLQNDQENKFSLLMAIKEVFLLKIGSALKFGPYYPLEFGFDLVVHQNSIEYKMEECISVDQRIFQNKEDLLSNLLMMHNLGIFHFDIKPENTMWSPTFKKYVFIDFNLSQIINVGYGEKKLMGFRGSLNYCGPEMIRTFYLGKQQFIDLRYNDSHCLESSFLQISRSKTEMTVETFKNIYQSDDEEDQILIYKWILLSQMKIRMFMDSWKEFKSLYSSYQKFIQKHLMIDILSFMEELEPTFELKQFFNKTIVSEQKNSLKFRQIFALLNQKCFFSHSKIIINQRRKDLFQLRVKSLPKEKELLEIHMTNSKIRQIICNNEEVCSLKANIYFSIYMKYISYSNNIFQNDENKRLKAAQTFMSYIKVNQQLIFPSKQKKLHEIEQSSSNIIQKSINIIFIWIQMYLNEFSLEIAQEQKQERCYDMTIYSIKQLQIDILEHIFILDLGNPQEIMQKIQLVYKSSINNEEEKIILLLMVRQFNKWNQSRFTLKGQMHRYEFYFIIQQWFIENLKNYEQHSSDKYKKVVSIILKNCQGDNYKKHHQFLTIDKTFLGYSKKLKLLIFIEIKEHVLNFKKQSFETVNLLLDLIYKQIDFQKKNGIHCFLFSLFSFYVDIKSDENCKLILDIFSRNLSDDTILNDLIIFYAYKSISCSNGREVCQFLKISYETIQRISLFDRIHHLDFLLIVQSICVDMMHKFHQKEFPHFQKIKETLGRLLKQINKTLVFYKQNRLKFRQILKNHQCFNFNLQTMIIEHQITFGMPYEAIISELEQMKNSFTYKDCSKCTYFFIVFFFLNIEDIIISRCSQHVEIEFWNARNQWRSYNFNYPSFLLIQKVDIEKGFAMNLFKFSKLSKQFEAKYHGIEKMYYYLKENSLIDSYFCSGVKSQAIIIFVMEIMYDRNRKQFMEFLNSLAIFVNHNLSLMNINILLFSFNQFIQRFTAEEIIKFQREFYTYSKLQVIDQICSLYYYLVYVNMLKIINFESTPTYLVKLLNNIPSRNKGFSTFMNFNLCRCKVLLIRQKGLKRVRELIYYNNHLIRSLIRLGYDSQGIKKYRKRENIFQQIIQEKALQIKGPFKIQNNRENTFQFATKNMK